MTDVRILLVDDEAFYLQLFSDFLATRRYYVKTASGGEEALALLLKEKFDILITDLLMEGMDGLVLTEKVQSSYPWVDIVVVTQRDDVRLAVRSMKMGVFEYLIKPVDRDELLLTLDRLLERRRLLDQQNKLIDESMEYLQAQTVYRRCLDILSTLDLENLCEMILRNTIQATGAQGGLLWLTSPEDRPEAGAEKLNLAGYRGLVTVEDFPTAIAVSEHPFQSAFDTKSPVFAKPSTVMGQQAERHNRDALFAPLTVEDEPVGLLLLLDKLREDFSERDQNITRTMVQFSAIALKNSRRFQALERVGLRDQTSAAYNLTYFIDYAGKEIYKARRYGRSFSLVTVVIDRFEFLREHFKAEVCVRMSRRLAESISKVVRDSDILARVSDHEYYVLLPETDALGARMFIRRSQEAFSSDDFIGKMSRDYPVSITLGAATFPLEGRDFDELLGVCRERSERTRSSLFRRLKLRDKGFWDTVQLLVGRPEDYNCPLESAGQTFRLGEDADGGSAHGIFLETVLEGIGEEVARQAVDLPSRRAILIDVGGVLGADQRPVERVVARAERAKAFVIGRKGPGSTESDHPALTRVFLDDEMMDRHRLLLVLSEHLAYAFLGTLKNRGRPQHQRVPQNTRTAGRPQKTGRQTTPQTTPQTSRAGKDCGELYGFNSHDHYLVENLIAKLQEHYNLQRQY